MSTSWQSRARRNAASRIFGGNTARNPDSYKKSPNAGLATFQQC
jgi:hypothetical protein